MQVYLFSTTRQYLNLRDELNWAIEEVLEKGKYVRGENVEAFEEEWARYCKAKYCVGVSSGTDALYVAFRALNFNKGVKGVNIPVRTFIATAEAAIRANYTVNLIDKTYPEMRQGVNVVVNLYGEAFSLPTSKSYIVEDSAQSHGIPLRGDIACFSFYPTKNLGCVGQGGALVTNDFNLSHTARMLINHGEGSTRFRHEILSGNYRLDEIQAAILRVKLPHLNAWNTRRRNIAIRYNNLLKDLKDKVTLPKVSPEHVFHIYNILTPERDSLGSFLEENGVETAKRYPLPLHLQPPFMADEQRFPEAVSWGKNCLSLPMYPELTDEEVEYVADAVRRFFTRFD